MSEFYTNARDRENERGRERAGESQCETLLASGLRASHYIQTSVSGCVWAARVT